MFSQLFGNYLVDRGAISREDYREVMEKQLDARVKLGTIAVAESLLTQEQAEMLNRLQLQFDRRFGDLAMERGLLTQEQVGQLLKKQGNPYLQFLQVLLESGKVTASQVDAHIRLFIQTFCDGDRRSGYTQYQPLCDQGFLYGTDPACGGIAVPAPGGTAHHRGL